MVTRHETKSDTFYVHLYTTLSMQWCRFIHLHDLCHLSDSRIKRADADDDAPNQIEIFNRNWPIDVLKTNLEMASFYHRDRQRRNGDRQFPIRRQRN